MTSEKTENEQYRYQLPGKYFGKETRKDVKNGVGGCKKTVSIRQKIMSYEKSLKCELPCRCLSPCCKTHWGDPGQGSSKRISRGSFRSKLPKKSLHSHDRWFNFILHILGQKCKFRIHSRRLPYQIWQDSLNLTRIILNLASSVVDPELFIPDPVPDPDPHHI